MIKPVKKADKAHVARIELSDGFLLNRGDRFTLRVVLSGDPDPSRKPIEHLGKIARGRIGPEPPRFGPGNRALLLGVASTWHWRACSPGCSSPRELEQESRRAPVARSCSRATAFAPAAQQIARQYLSNCPGAHITVGGAPTSPGR